MENAQHKIDVGDIVRVVRKDGKIYECMVVTKVPHYGAFYGRITENTSGVPTTSWDRYVPANEGILQFLNDCSYVKCLSEAQVIKEKPVVKLTESASGKEYTSEDVTFYKTKLPREDKYLTLCITEDCAGWSDDPSDNALLESFVNAKSVNYKKSKDC